MNIIREIRRIALLITAAHSLAGYSGPAQGIDWHVDSKSTASGKTGSAARPFRTIQEAVDIAIAGDTIIVENGAYREAIELRRNGRPDAPISFVARGAVVVDGADPLNARSFKDVSMSAETSRGLRVWANADYTPRFAPSPGGNSLNDLNRQNWEKLGPSGHEQVERFSRTDMIWLDGDRVPEVRQRDELSSRSCWIDVADKALLLALDAGDDPGFHLIEATVRGALFHGAASYVSVKGFHFTRAGNQWDSGAITMGPDSEGWILENNKTDWNNWGGIHIKGRGHRLSRNVSENNGSQGFSGAYLSGVLMDGNVTRLNNWKNHRWEFQAGGMKLAWAKDVTIRNQIAEFNVGPGIWLDIDNENIVIENCRANHNTYAGIFVEISPGKTIIRDNFCYANDGAGILIAESPNVECVNNLVLSNKWGIALRDIPAREHSTRDVTITNNLIVDNGAGIFSPMRLIMDAGIKNIVLAQNTFWNNPALATYANMKKLNFGTFLTPRTTGIATFDLETVQKQLHLEDGSVEEDPNFDPVLRATYELKWPGK